jgi:hypothetical protein
MGKSAKFGGHLGFMQIGYVLFVFFSFLTPQNDKYDDIVKVK